MHPVVAPHLPSASAKQEPKTGDLEELEEREQQPQCLEPRGLGRVSSIWHTADHSQLVCVWWGGVQ